MTSVRGIHRSAMEIAGQAFTASRNGAHDEALRLFVDAYTLEYKAAQLTEKEPSRSILYRSAATLALHAQLFREAERIAALGLAGDPPPQIAEELRDVFERTNFHRHLSLQGVTLNPNELQMTIVGDAVAQGMALIGAVFERVQQLERLIIRTGHRINQRPFSQISKKEPLKLYTSTPRSGSFAVTLRVGDSDQKMLPEMDDRPRIIDEVIHSLDLLNSNKIEELRATIPDKDYYESFLGIAKKIAPDGEDVKMVGVTALRNGEEASVGFSKTAKDIKPILTEVAEEVSLFEQEFRELVRITGELLYAEAIKKNRIKVVDDNNKTYLIEVSEAIAEDVVRPYFGARVTVDAIKIGEKQYIFRDINQSEE